MSEVLRELVVALSLDSDNFARNLRTNSKTLQNNADAVATAQANLNNAKAAVKSTEAEIRKLTEQLYRMKSHWTQAGEHLTAFAKKCETVSKAMVTAGHGMTKYLTTPILALGTTAIKASIDYESAFTSVRKTVNATEAEFSALSDSIKQMSTHVASSANDIAEVVAIAGQLGIENRSLMGFARTMIDLGNSTDIVASDAASTMAKFANITKMKHEAMRMTSAVCPSAPLYRISCGLSSTLLIINAAR